MLCWIFDGVCFWVSGLEDTVLSDEPLRVGVVGLGKMGLLHTSILNVLPKAQLTAVCEKSALIRKLARRLLRDVAVVDDVAEFSDLDLDAVFVTTPTSSHYSVAKLLYVNKLARHLFVEKPLASTYLQSKNLCDLAALNGGVNMVGYLRRFYVTFKKAKALLDQGLVGEVSSFTVNALSSDFCGVVDGGKASIARGGVLRDLGSYAIDLALWFFGDLGVKSAKIESLTGAESEDVAKFVVQRAFNGVQGEFLVSWCAEGYRVPEVNLLVRGTKGLLEVNDDKVSLSPNNEGKIVWFRHNLSDSVGFWLGNPEYYREDDYFLEAILSHSMAEPCFKTASNVDHLIETVLEEAGKT